VFIAADQSIVILEFKQIIPYVINVKSKMSSKFEKLFILAAIVLIATVNIIWWFW